MAEPFVPSAEHVVVLYTETTEIRGRLETRPPCRLMDALNDRDRPFLLLTEATIRSLFPAPEADEVRASSVLVRKKYILLAWLMEENEVHERVEYIVPRLAQSVVLHVGPFIVRGAVHLMGTTSLVQAWDTLRDDFFALTDASALSAVSPGLTLGGGLMAAVQRDQVAAIREVQK